MSIEHEKLKAEAKPLGLFVGVHREWTSGPYFVSVWKDQRNQLGKFLTAAQVRDVFADYAAGRPIKPPKLQQKTDDEVTEHSVLVRKARPLGFYVGEHKFFDPAMGGGPYFVVAKRGRGNTGEAMPTILKYATREQVEEFLENEAANYAA